MTEQKFIQICRKYISDYYDGKVKEDEIYVVWLCRILQNNKALLSSNNPDGLYFECTYNGDKKEMYLDVYKRQWNECINGIS